MFGQTNMQKIKVLHLVKKYDGNYPLRNAMILGPAAERFEIKICYLTGTPDGTNLLDRYDKSIYLENESPEGAKRSPFISLIKLLRKERPEILHCHRHKPSLYGILAGLLFSDMKIVAHVHGLRRTRNLCRKITNALLSWRISRFIAVSDAVAEDIIKSNWFIEPSKVKTIYNGISLEPFDLLTISGAAAKKQMDIPDDAFVFGTVGRLVKTKGHSYLIEAFSQVESHFPNSRLVIIGEGTLDNDLKGLAAKLGISKKVIFCGYRKDVLQLLRGFDVFVFPSIAEGLGLALMEAMASRLPAIASRAGGIPEVFGAAECGQLVPPGDPHALAEAMQKLASLPPARRKEMGDSARKRVEAAFTQELMYRGLESVYETIVDSA